MVISEWRNYKGRKLDQNGAVIECRCCFIELTTDIQSRSRNLWIAGPFLSPGWKTARTTISVSDPLASVVSRLNNLVKTSCVVSERGDQDTCIHTH